jgi:hypothetical protein
MYFTGVPTYTYNFSLFYIIETVRVFCRVGAEAEERADDRNITIEHDRLYICLKVQRNIILCCAKCGKAHLKYSHIQCLSLNYSWT